MEVNPWGSSVSQVSVGGMSDLLTWIHGNVGVDSAPCSQVDVSSSAELLDLLESVRRASCELDECKIAFQQVVQEGHAKDILSAESLKQKIDVLKSMNDHLEAIIQHRQKLVTRLQQPYASETLFVESDCHEDFVQFLYQMSDLITNAEQICQNMKWCKSFELEDPEVGSVLKGTSTALARFQNYTETLNQSRNILESYMHLSAIRN